MTSATGSLFTEAIEEHLALKRQNAHLNESMPLARYSVGDPLERFPGGPVKPVVDDEGTTTTGAAPGENTSEIPADSAYAMGATTLNGMVPSLSLVEDLDETSVMDMAGAFAGDTAPSDAPQASVLRFPGGVGADRAATPEFDPMPAAAGGAALATVEPPLAGVATATIDPPTASEHSPEQPVIVIDADEPLAAGRSVEPMAPRTTRKSGGGGLFGGLRRGKKRDGGQGAGGNGWFTGNPREFTWDD